MKNEPLLTYNHMEEELTIPNAGVSDNHVPVSVIMIVVVDILLMGVLSAIVFHLAF